MDAEATLGAIIRARTAELHATDPLTPHQLRVLRSLADCRTAALGGHRDHCDRCEYEHVFWNSCRNRHCPACGAEARQSWLEARRAEILDVPYFHAVFTVPPAFHRFARYAPALFYAVLLRAAGQAIVDVAATKLRARFGVLTVVHTWGQTLAFHPHAHCIIPGGGFSADGRRWVRVPKVDFLFAVKVLRRRFRTLVCNALREAYADGSLVVPVHVVHDATALDLLLAQASRTDWHAYVKPPFGGAGHVLAYLAAYTHRIAISNRRILSFDGENVTFSWRDYADGNQQKEMTLSAVEFLRRLATHIVPPRFTRIRYYGFLANPSAPQTSSGLASSSGRVWLSARSSDTRRSVRAATRAPCSGWPASILCGRERGSIPHERKRPSVCLRARHPRVVLCGLCPMRRNAPATETRRLCAGACHAIPRCHFPHS